MHANDVVHGDLTGVSLAFAANFAQFSHQLQPNILIYGDGTACLSDFGLSLVPSEFMCPSFSMTSTLRGNYRWMAPELLDGDDNEPLALSSKLSDIYSFGSVMLHVCFLMVSASNLF